MSNELQTSRSGIEVEVTVDGIELDEQQQRVVDMYTKNIHTFVRKNQDYGGSFENSAKLESIMRYGEVRQDELFDIIAEQILVRGFYDKLSRFHQLQIQDGENRVGEKIEDTLLDMGNYCIMLASMQQKYEQESLETAEISFAKDGEWSEDDVEEFMDQFDAEDHSNNAVSGNQE